MSTKIHNGYRKRKPQSLQETLREMSELCEEHRKETPGILRKTCEDKYQRESWLHAATLILETTSQPQENPTGNPEVVKAATAKAAKTVEWEALQGAKKMDQKYRSFGFDFILDICFFPYREKHIFLVFSEQQEPLKKAIQKLGLVDYHYQNSTDKPKRISEKEWSQRKRDWKKIYPETSPPAKNSWSATSHETKEYTTLLRRIARGDTWKNIRNPSWEEALTATKNAIVQKELGKQIQAWSKENPEKECAMHQISGWFFKLSEFWNQTRDSLATTQSPEKTQHQTRLEETAKAVAALSWA